MKSEWDNVDWNLLKRSRALQLQYSKEFGIAKYDPERQEKIYDSQEQRELNVFLGADSLSLNHNVKLLSEIYCSHDSQNFKKEFMGISPIGRSIIISRMLGYSFQQISKITGLNNYQVKQSLDKAVQKVVKLNINKCQDCAYLSPKLICALFKIKVKRDFYCGAHSMNKAKRFEIELNKILSIIEDSEKEKVIKSEIIKLLRGE